MNQEPVRGERLGAISNESLVGVTPSPRQTISYICPASHVSELIFAAEVEIPEKWDCRKCGKEALRQGLESASESNIQTKISRTHFDFLLERRSREDLEQILQEALEDLKVRRRKNVS